jgi:hypothetical protein
MTHPFHPDTLATLPEEVRNYLENLEAATRQTPASLPLPALRLKDVTQRIPSFNGNRRHLKSFLFDIDQAIETFPTSFPNEHTKIRYAANFLTGPARLWWQTNYKTATQEGTFETTTYSIFAASLKAHFGDHLEERSIMNRWHHLQQTGSVSDYIIKFKTLQAEVQPPLALALSHFERGLKPNIQNVLASLPPFQDLEALMVAADQLDQRQFRLHRTERNQAAYSRPQLRPPSNDHKALQDDRMLLDNSIKKPHSKLSDQERHERHQKGLCHYCGRPGHFSVSCPNKKPRSKN